MSHIKSSHNIEGEIGTVLTLVHFLLTLTCGPSSRRILINHFFFCLSVPKPNKENCERVLLCLEFENRIRNGAKRCPAVLMWGVFPCFHRLRWLFGHFVDCDVKLRVIQPRFRSHDTPWPSSRRMTPGEYYIPTQSRFGFVTRHGLSHTHFGAEFHVNK